MQSESGRKDWEERRGAVIGVEEEGRSEGEQLEVEEEALAVAVVAEDVGGGKWRGGGRADDGRRTRRVALM